MSFIRDVLAHLDRMYNAIDHAKQIGTFNAVDRSRQYDDDDPKKLRSAVNDAWTKIRRNERAIADKDADIGFLKQRDRATKLKLWILSSAVAALFALNLVLLQILLERVVR